MPSSPYTHHLKGVRTPRPSGRGFVSQTSFVRTIHINGPDISITPASSTQRERAVFGKVIRPESLLPAVPFSMPQSV